MTHNIVNSSFTQFNPSQRIITICVRNVSVYETFNGKAFRGDKYIEV